MQPCPNCGRAEITPAGNCQNCGLFRGNEGYGGAGYGQGNPQGPWQHRPAQQAPPEYGYQQPYPAQPQYGAGYRDPHAYPDVLQPVQPARRPSTVPLIVLSVVAVILVIGIVGVVVVRAGQDEDKGGGGGTTAAGIDECVVGTWRVTSAKEKVEQNGTITEFTSRGGTVELKADGTGRSDYGSGVVYTGRVSGQSVTITFTGSVTFSFKTVDSSFTFSNPSPNGTATVKVNGTTTTAIPLDMDTKPAKYTCAGNRLTQSTDLATTELSR
jgi:hypothetical protein